MVLPNMQIPRPVLVKQLNNYQAEIDTFCEERIEWCRAATATHGSDQAVGDDVRTLSVKYGPDGTRRR
eukprot:1564976-Pyramimonas_sp.AAC.1